MAYGVVSYLMNIKGFILKNILSILGLKYKNKPIPYKLIESLDWLANGDLAAYRPNHMINPHNNKSLLNAPFLRKNVSAAILKNRMTITVDTLNYIEKRIISEKPKVVLEFGSGLSTICLSYYLSTLYETKDHIFVYSIDEKLEYAENTNKMLRDLSLDSCARVIHVDLVEREINGVQVFCYNINSNTLDSLLQGEQPEFILIDGPSGGGLNRYYSITQITSNIAPNAFFFLDDAMRKHEMQVSHLWKQLPYIKIHGMTLLGTGILEGQYQLTSN